VKTAEAAQHMTVDEAIEILNCSRHRGFENWKEESLVMPTIVSRDHDGDLQGPRLNRFEAIAIAQRYKREL